MARALPLTATKAPADLITSALFNTGVIYLSQFMLAPPLFRGRNTTGPSVASGAWTVLPLDTTDFDSDSGHSNVTNNSRYTCQVPGWYFVEGYVALQNTGGACRCESGVFKNGANVPSSQFVWRVADLQSWMCGALVQLAAGDYVEVAVRQNSGGAIVMFAGVDLAPCMNLFFVHP